MNRFFALLLVLLMPFSLVAGEIQHVLGGVAELLFIAAVIAIVFYVLLPIIYYNSRNKVLAYVVYAVGGLTFLVGLLIAMSGSADAVVLGLIFSALGLVLFRLPTKRKPL